jgi:hypothetical protein
MNKIPLKQAVSSGVWYECRAKQYDEKVHFRLRVLGFERTSVEELDPSNEQGVTAEGVLWLLSLEVVNLSKKPVDASTLPDVMRLIDEDGFEFEAFASDLSYVDGSPLFRFSGGCCQRLSPKIKASGAVAFTLPDEDSKYYLVFNEGSVKEA